MTKFTEEQVKKLEEKLNTKFISKRKQGGITLDYIEGWYAIQKANEIFGYDGWNRETIMLKEACEPQKNKNGNNVVSFIAQVKVTVGDIIRIGTGYGSGIAFSLGDAYENAVKEAETDAMKRALMTFGNQFGLALYDKEKKNVTNKMSNEEAEKLIKEVRGRLAIIKDEDIPNYKRELVPSYTMMTEEYQNKFKELFKAYEEK